MSKTLIAVVAVFAFANHAFAAEPQFATGNMKTTVVEMDSDRDSSVTREEFLAYWAGQYDKLKKDDKVISNPAMADNMLNMIRYLQGPANAQ